MRLVAVAMVLVGSVLFHLASAPRAAACSCFPAMDDEHFAHAEAVFAGKFVGYFDLRADPRPPGSSEPVMWVFAAHQVYKGTVAERQGVMSAVSGASCGLEIAKEGEFLVFARGEPPFPENRVDGATLYAGLCGGTRSLAAQPVPASFRPPRPPAPGWSGVVDLRRATVAAPPAVPDGEPANDVFPWSWIAAGISAAAALGVVAATSGIGRRRPHDS